MFVLGKETQQVSRRRAGGGSWVITQPWHQALWGADFHVQLKCTHQGRAQSLP